MSDSPALPTSALRRRDVLGATGAGALLLGAPLPSAGAAPAAGASAGHPRTVLRFGVVTDTHINVDPRFADRQVTLRRAYDHMVARGADLALHCGDLTDVGSPQELATCLRTIPAALRGRVHHVPGNHEWRWDGSVGEDYVRRLGATDRTFVARGVRFVALSPWQVLEEPGLVGEQRLAWLDRALSGSGADRGLPVVCFTHMPIGRENYFVNDQDALRTVLERHGVRLLLTGHTHEFATDTFNGITQVVGNSTMEDDGWLLWCEVVRDGRTLILTVDNVNLRAPGKDPVTTRVATVPLTGPLPGVGLRPAGVGVAAAARAVAVTIEPGRDAPSTVTAQVYPQFVYGEKEAPKPVTLTRGADGRYSGTLPFDRPVPGEHRVQVRLTSGSASYDVTSRFTVPTTAAAVVDQDRLGGRVQAGMTRAGDLVVAASSTGVVRAYRVAGSRLQRAWAGRVGPVYRSGAGVDDLVLLPSADHRLYALDRGTGRVRWRAQLGAPVVSKVTVAPVDGCDQVFVAAGRRTFRIDPERGRVVWSAGQGGMAAGALAVDDDRVFVGSGDGNAYAFDARTGATRWVADIADRWTPQDVAGNRLFGPWAYAPLLPTPGTVVFGTVRLTRALSRESGATVWEAEGDRAFAPGLVLPRGLLLVSEYWGIDLLDPRTGARTLQVKDLYPQRFFESGPVVDGDDLYAYGVTGRLLHVDLATGRRTELLQASVANTFSTPVLVTEGTERHLVNGFQDGVVRLVRLR